MYWALSLTAVQHLRLHESEIRLSSSQIALNKDYTPLWRSKFQYIICCINKKNSSCAVHQRINGITLAKKRREYIMRKLSIVRFNPKPEYFKEFIGK